MNQPDDPDQPVVVVAETFASDGVIYMRRTTFPASLFAAYPKLAPVMVRNLLAEGLRRDCAKQGVEPGEITFWNEAQ